MNNTLVFDLEADNLLVEATKIHCIVIKDLSTDTMYKYADSEESPTAHYDLDGTIIEGLDHLAQGDVLVGHNITGFDIPLIKKLHGIDFYKGRGLEDTMLMSQIQDPDTKHSLAALSEKAGSSATKIENEDWSVLTVNMLSRCMEDVNLNHDVYNMLKAEMSKADPKGKALSLETSVALLHANQVMYGVCFNMPKAIDLLTELDTKIVTLSHKILMNAPKKCIQPYPTPIEEPFIKSGALNSRVVKWFDKEGVELEQANVCGKFSRVRFEDINLSSDTQVKNLLLSLGWKPTEWNFSKATGLRTSPKLTEDSYSSLPLGLGQQIAELNVCKHRRRFLLNMKDPTKGAIPSVRNDGRVSAEAITCGTNTARYRHQGTVCNVPRITTPYGEIIRSLFCVPDGSLQIGLDLKGIEARVLAHYIKKYPGSKDTVDRILSGDFHSYNAKVWGVTRDLAKNGLYALTYGCGDAKLASTLEKGKGQGKRLRDIFWKENPVIKLLIDDLERAYAAHPGYIYGLDGRRLVIRDKRKLLNTLLQNAAAVIFKEWMVRCDKYLAKSPIAFQMMAVHDEIQIQINTEDRGIAKGVAEDLRAMINDVERDLGILVPLDVDYKVNKSWAGCH